MPRWVVSKSIDALNDRRKSLKGSKVLVLGIAYKKNVNDMRESPAVELMELLLSKGALVDYSDPYVPVFPKMREHYFDRSSIEMTVDNVAEYDLLLLATDHDIFDYDMIQKNAQLIVDTRGRYLEKVDNVVKA